MTLLKIGFESAIILNVLSIITWILLGIFPGLYYLSMGAVLEGLQFMFLNIWFILFTITLIIIFFLRTFVKKEEDKSKAIEKLE